MSRSWRLDRRERWATAVRQSLHLTPGQRIVCLETVRHMAADGKFAVERKTIATVLRLSDPSRVSEAWTAARAAGLLVLVTKMAYGQPSRYQATFPDTACSDACTRGTHVQEDVVNRVAPRTPGRSLLDWARELTPPVVSGKSAHHSKTPNHPNRETAAGVSPNSVSDEPTATNVRAAVNHVRNEERSYEEEEGT